MNMFQKKMKLGVIVGTREIFSGKLVKDVRGSFVPRKRDRRRGPGRDLYGYPTTRETLCIPIYGEQDGNGARFVISSIEGVIAKA